MSESQLVCCHHLQGRCDRGESCTYSHDDIDSRPCQFGVNCRLRHWLRRWEHDGVTDNCRCCNKAFSIFTTWRHHCRLGGELCCWYCLTEVEPFGKVCEHCLRRHRARQEAEELSRRRHRLREEVSQRRQNRVARRGDWHGESVAGGGARVAADPLPRIVADVPAAAAVIRAHREALAKFGADQPAQRKMDIAEYGAGLVRALQRKAAALDDLLKLVKEDRPIGSDFTLHADPISVPADRTAPLLTNNEALRGTSSHGIVGWLLALMRLEAEAVPDVERRRAMGAAHDLSRTSLGRLLEDLANVRTILEANLLESRVDAVAKQADIAVRSHYAIDALHARAVDFDIAVDEIFAASLFTMNLAPLPGQSANRSLFAVANLLCRLARDPSLRRPCTAAGHELTHAEVLAMLRVYAPFIIRIDTFLCRLPQSRRTLFRGVNYDFNLALYDAGETVAWGAMTSTSDSLLVAQGFAKGRTLVIVHAGSTARIDFLSPYGAERETLLPTFTLFTSLGVTSTGLMRLLGQQGSIISLRELGDVPSPGQDLEEVEQNISNVIEGMQEAKIPLRRLSYNFRQLYVQARVSFTPPPVPDSARILTLFDLLNKFLNRDTTDFAGGADTHLALLGDGGTGKTTALLALHCYLARRSWHFGLEQPIISLFIALPKLPDVQNGAHIDAQVFAELGAASEQHAAQIAQRAIIVVLLDSLDECTVRNRRAWRPLLDTAPFCREHCRCIMSTRSEFRERVPAGVELLCSGGACTTMYVLPLTVADELDFIRRFCAAHEAEVDDVQRCLARLQLADEDSRLPVLLTMTLEIAVQDARLGAPRGVYSPAAPAAAPEPQAGGGAASSGPIGGDQEQQPEQQQQQRGKKRAPHAGGGAAAQAVIGNGTIQHAWKRYSLRDRQFIDYEEETAQAIEEGIHEQQSTITFDTFTIDLGKFVQVDDERERDHHHHHVCRFVDERIVAGLNEFEQCKDWKCRDAAAALRALQPAAAADSSLQQQQRERPLDLDWLPEPGTRAHVFERFLDVRRTAPITVNRNDKVDETIPLAAHQEILQLLQDTALRMLDTGNWHVPVGSLRQRCLDIVPPSERKNESHNDRMFRIFGHHVPCRIEAIHDDDSAFAFWHKSLAEYLCARALFLSPIDSLAKLTDWFSIREPGVLRAFNDICGSDLRRRAIISLGPLYATVRSAASSPHARSNALALLCASGFPLGGFSFSNIEIDECNLQEAGLCCVNLRGARITNSILRNARFDEAHVEQLQLWENQYSAPLPPLEGHSNNITCLAFSSDGERIASGDSGGGMRVWSATSGRETFSLEGDPRRVHSLAFSPSGDRLLAGGDDHRVRVYATSTGEELMQLAGHNGHVNAVAFAPSGLQVASGSADRTVKVWSLAMSRPVLNLNHHNYAVNCVTYSPSGSIIASGGDGQAVIVCDATTGAVRFRFVHHGAGARVLSIAFSFEGNLVVSGDQRGKIIVWDAATGDVIKEIAGRGEISSIGFLPDGVRVFSASDCALAWLWDAASGRELQQLTGHGGVVAFSPNGRHFAAAEGNRVILNKFTSAAALKPRVGHTAPIVSVACFENGQRLFSASSVHSLCIWDVASARLVQTLNGPPGQLTCAAITPDGRYAASAGELILDDENSSDEQHDILLWDMINGTVTKRLHGHTNGVFCLAFSPSGDRLVSGGSDASVRVWSIPTGDELMNLGSLHSDWVRAVAFTPDGLHVASAGMDKTVRVWSLETRGTVLFTVTGHDTAVVCLAYSPCGSMLASGCSARLMLTSNGADAARQHVQLRGHDAPVLSVAFFANGQSLASGDRGGTVIVWSAASGNRTRRLVGHVGPVSSLCCSPSGDVLVSGGQDRSIRVALLAHSTFSSHIALPQGVGADQLRRITFIDRGQRLAIVVAPNQNTRRCFVAHLCAKNLQFVEANTNQQQQEEAQHPNENHRQHQLGKIECVFELLSARLVPAQADDANAVATIRVSRARPTLTILARADRGDGFVGCVGTLAADSDPIPLALVRK